VHLVLCDAGGLGGECSRDAELNGDGRGVCGTFAARGTLLS
jgi:hypothetical protein